MNRLSIVGAMCLSRDAIIGPSNWFPDWVLVGINEDPEALFVSYDQSPLWYPIPTSVRVIGTNMSRPNWATPAGMQVVTTRDIPRYIMNDVTPTAEHALGLALALHRNLVPASQNPRADRNLFLAPKMLSRMTAGIMGLGRIGSMLQRYLEPLMLRVLHWDPANNGGYFSPEGVLQAADILFLCCPASPFGHPMGKVEFDQMLGGITVNIAQPDLIDWEAAIEAVNDGRLRGIAADVYPQWVADKWIQFGQHFQNHVLLTPHIAGSTLDARMITEKALLDVMREKLNG